MRSVLCHAIVLLTAVSTLWAGVPSQVPTDDTGFAVVSAQHPVGDDADKPRGASDAEESEEEDSFEVELLAERSTACGPNVDIVACVDLVNLAWGRRLAWPTSLIRGPPASA
jgi:hypothetical protein